MNDMKTIGTKLKILRENAGFTQKSIADFLHVDQSLVSKLENGERNISADMLDRLASLFGVQRKAIVEEAATAAPMPHASRCGSLSASDMEAISAVNKIALNLQFMEGLLKEAGKRSTKLN